MNTNQKAMAELMRYVKFNNFDGDHVADHLEAREDLYIGFIFGSFGSTPLHALRDIADCDCLNGDTLYIQPKPGKEDDLENLVNECFGADEVEWKSIEESGEMRFGGAMETNQKYILRVWWE